MFCARQKRPRILALALCVVMLLGMWGSAAAEETSGSYVAKNGYVYHFGSGAIAYEYAQFSPFVPILSYDNGSVDGYGIIFGLDNKTTNTTFEKLYCVDMPVDALADGIDYRPLNLSDSTYAAALAGKLRAIVLHTYPYKTVSEVAAASGITGLTRGEAITASQLAIWKTAHGDNVQITDFMSYVSYTISTGTSSIQNELNEERDAYRDGDDAYKAAVKARIEAFYNYLMTRPAQSATKQVVSEASFTEHSTAPTVVQNEDGTYNVTVTVTVNVQMDVDDTLTLTAHMADGQYSASTDLSNGQSSYTLTIQNVPAEYANSTVTVAIDGTQRLCDVYLVDADGIRGVSQSMIGALNDTVPVHAETKMEPDRVLKLYKTAGGKPLSGISFEVYWAGSLEEYYAGTLGIGKTPTDADIRKYAQSTNLVGTLTTNESGCASLNFGTTDGVYLLKELPDDRVSGLCDPFFVVLPYDYGNGNGPYTVTVQPKNTLNLGGIQLEKVDANDTEKKLAGATFEVYRKATQSEIAAGGTTSMVIGETTYQMIRVSFYTDSGMSGDKVTQLTTDENGRGGIYGLAYGNYYLVETQAPAGYNKLSGPTEFQIKASSNGEVQTLTVANTAGVELPSTGGIGAEPVMALGLTLMTLAAVALLVGKKRRAI